MYNVITKNIVAVFKVLQFVPYRSQTSQLLLFFLLQCQQKSMYPTINKTSADDHVIVEMISKHKGLLKK